MVIDSSALIAILENEAESPALRGAIGRDAVRLISAATMVEASIVALARRGEPGLAILDVFCERADIVVVPLENDQVRAAVDAFRRFGKGRHPAGLNFGDCFSYALARTTGESLLFKGGDFSLTDVTPAA
ncbi:type II toxin-antitoxin system VapC family toxin [Jiella sonneratiae]|uniref:Ribonuclease VapC n=1 Tax=Jiella sonneratiae TaxID=2816856 RepID=A0ABS3J0H9_9HYPH|nr:type II toxin-antitoxin system VapC family toxin [Jiella sonneratiae]MBO0903168.1 type II toxin-antitoxin system VapC family toxin [Jiella sonneratiae]